MKLNTGQQEFIVNYVRDTYDTFKTQLEYYRARMSRVYDAVNTFESEKANDWDTTIKVNKAFEIENKVLPRIIANNPTWLVTQNTDEFDPGDMELPVEEYLAKRDKIETYAQAIRDYLRTVFNEEYVEELVKLWVKNAVRYGLGRSKVCYRYDIDFEPAKEEVTLYDEDGQEIKEIQEKTKEKVRKETPSIDVSTWSDIYFDPRFIRLEDMPGLVEVKEGVRLSFFTRDPKKYMNVDKLIEIAGLEFEDEETYNEEIKRIAGINTKVSSKLNMNNLTVKKFYGRCEINDKGEQKTGKGEKLYEFWTINDMITAYAKEIAFIPFEVIKCFEDTETFFATGFLEPILGLQDELNHKKNSAAVYINQALNRNWVRSPNSGVDPKTLNSAPGNVIVTNRSAEEALANLQEVPFRALPPNFFQEQADFERQIQGLSFTIDTSSQKGNQALTNTATGIRIKAFESNAVVDMIRKNVERSLERLAYKFLQKTFENLDDNIIIEKIDEDGFWEINKEAMRDAVRRRKIKVEAGSTSLDTLDNRREDAIAKRNIGLTAAQAGVPTDLTKLYKGVMSTFEDVDPDELIKKPNPLEAMMPQQQEGGNAKPIPMPNKASPAPGQIPL